MYTSSASELRSFGESELPLAIGWGAMLAMNDRKPRDLTRRKFLITAGGAASALTFGCSPSTGPPPTVRVTAGNSITGANASPDLPALTLTAANSGTFGWTFGHAFKQGDVPAGTYIQGSNASAFHADPRNYWADASVKFAVLSGISDLTVNTPLSIQLSTSATAPSGTNVPEPTSSQVANVRVHLSTTGTTYSIGSSADYYLSACLSTDISGSSNFSTASAGRVRAILGPVMSEFHYLQNVNSLLHVWWYVRRYSTGAIEIERVIENGWWPTAGQTQVDYGVVSYTDSSSTPDYELAYIGHFAFTRWTRVDWIGGAPVNPQHDAAYLRSTQMVPNYGYTNPTENSYNGNASTDLAPWASNLNPPPYTLGNWTPIMGDAGYQSAIGILPQWESVYCSASGSVDIQARAYAATISNHRGMGAWPFYRRDPSTGRPVNYLSYPNVAFLNWSLDPSPASGGYFGTLDANDVAHLPSNGYLNTAS